MGLLRKKKEKCPACERPFEDHEEFIEHITTIHPEERPCPKCKGTMRWVDSSNVGGSHTQYERPQPTCDNCGYMEHYVGWDEWDGEYGKKKKNFYPELEKNEDTGKWDIKK
jgi:endogenous inhibitor of DNA gyrase (YacG/DUF329 family)